MKTENDIKALDRAGLCQFLGLRSDNEQSTNIEALQNDAFALLEERLDNDEIVFEFDELDDNAKWKVVELCRPDHAWWEDSTDYYREKAAELGLDMDNYRFDMGTSQGGNAWWWGRIDLLAFLEKNPPDADKPADVYKHEVYKTLLEDGRIEPRVAVGHGRNHSRHGSTQVEDIEVDDTEDPDTCIRTGLFTGVDFGVLLAGAGGIQDLQDAIEDAADKLDALIYKSLQEEDEHYSSFEYAKETCEANDWVFDKEGTLVDRPETTAQAADHQLSLVFETLGEPS
jgi:hypothetical protein